MSRWETVEIKDTIQSLYQILVQVTAYETTNTTATSSPSPGMSTSTRPPPPTSREALAHEFRALQASLRRVHAAATTPTPEAALPRIPVDLVMYVENGRNPDIYTREFVENVRRSNQYLCGKSRAFTDFRDVLAGEMDKALPELRKETAMVVEATSPSPPANGSHH